MGSHAQTVNGVVPAAALGRTLMHEHILGDLRDPATRDRGQVDAKITINNRFETDYFQNRNQANMLLDEDEVAIAELTRLRQAGGGTIVELTVGGLRPQPQRLAAIGKQADVHIVVGAGYYVDRYLSESTRSADIDELEALICAQIEDGVWGTSIRPGLIGEIGCSWPLAPSERRMLVAAARVQRRTGIALTIHPGRNPDAPAEIADILTEAGADLSRTVIDHIDRTIFDRDRLIDLLDRGLVLEWDFFGIETSQYWMDGADVDLPTDYMRLDLIKALMALGHREQVVVSHDICTRTRLAAYGGHGYAHLFSHIVPMMQRRGWRDSDIEQLLEKTPARLLCYLSEPPPHHDPAS